MASPMPTVFGPSWVSQVDPSVPIFGNPTTQSVRSNFAIIKQELEALAAQVALGYPIPVSDGGTGASTTPDGLINLGIVSYLANTIGSPVNIASGGTGANNVFQARMNLGAAPLFNPNFTGNPTAPTPPSSDSSMSLATTAFVQTAINNMVPITIARGGTGASSAPQALINLGAAPINNPTFTGVPFAPNPNPGTANQQIATTAFVMAAVGSGGSGGAPPVTYGPTAPSNPQVGQLWFDTTTSTLMVWSGSAWTVTVPAGAAGPPGPPGTNFVSDNPPAIPPAVAGNMWWDSSNGQLYVLFNNQGTNQWVIANNQPGPAGPTGATGPAGPTGPAGTPWPEAPTDGSLYGRDGATTSWQLVPPEAPLGGAPYLRIGGNQTNPGSWVQGLPLSGGTLTGMLALDADATLAMQAVTLQQMNASVTQLSVVGTNAPANPRTGQLWWNTNDGQGYVWTGAQWVVYVSPPLGNYLALSGGTMTGPAALVGVTNGSNAAAGQVGEYLTASNPSAVSLPAGWQSPLSLALSAGDWDVWGSIAFISSNGTVTQCVAGISTTPSIQPSGPLSQLIIGGITQWYTPLVSIRQSVTSTTTVYINAFAGGGTSTNTVICTLFARRVR